MLYLVIKETKSHILYPQRKYVNLAQTHGGASVITAKFNLENEEISDCFSLLQVSEEEKLFFF